ncbi:MAG: Hydrolase, alpha/beta domain protein [Microgenomates group bacterium GW2011_GWC1_39_12]|nr:MAG: Hydrolase, alpha/beta domain protein [Microgenomates group bacterium GW2011_GWC1_39_12]
MKNGKTIILLHGWGRAKNARTAYHDTIVEFEKKGYTVYAPDMPGFGEAAIPTHPLTLHDYSEFLRSFIKEKNIKTPILIGHSFGGRVVIKYVSSENTDAKAIILCGTPGYRPVKQTKWVVFVGISKIGKLIFSLPGLSKIADKIRGWFYYIIGARDFYRAEGAMRQTFKNIVGEPLIKYMKSIRVPTLLLWGEEDIIVPVRIANKMKETIPNAKLIILPHGKHSVIIDDPKNFVKEVCLFL